MNRPPPQQRPVPIISTQPYSDAKIIECRCNASKTIIEEGSDNSAWTCYFDDPILLKTGDQLALNLGIVNTSSAAGEVIEITDNNNTGFIKTMFYYGDGTPIGQFSSTGFFQRYYQFRQYQYVTDPFTDPIGNFDNAPLLIDGVPKSPEQVIQASNPFPMANLNYTDNFGGGSANILPGNNTDLWFITGQNSQPFECIHTITIPNGFYSPTNIADIINKQINQTYVKWFKYHGIVGGYSPPIPSQDNAFFTREIGYTPMNIFTIVKLPQSTLNGSAYNNTYPDGLNSIMNQYPTNYELYCLPDPNGIVYPSTGLTNTSTPAFPTGTNWWSPPEVFGGLYSQFQFNTTSGKFEFNNLHTPVRWTDNSGDNFPSSSTNTNPSFSFGTNDYQVNNNWVRNIRLAEGGVGIKLKGSLWDTLGFNTATDSDYNLGWNYSGGNVTNYNQWVQTYNFTISDPFASTQYGINNIGETGNSNAWQYVMNSMDAQLDTTLYDPALWQANRKPINIFFPQLNVQLANILGISDIIPKPRGFRVFNWNSTTIQASDFAEKVTGGYYLVQSDILGNDLTYISESGKSLPICGILFKNYSANDFYFSFNAIVPFLVKNDRIIRSIYIRLLNPDFTKPTNLGSKSAIFFELSSTFQQPIYMTTERPKDTT